MAIWLSWSREPFSRWSTLSCLPALIHMFEIWPSNVSLSSISMPNTFLMQRICDDINRTTFKWYAVVICIVINVNVTVEQKYIIDKDVKQQGDPLLIPEVHIFLSATNHFFCHVFWPWDKKPTVLKMDKEIAELHDIFNPHTPRPHHLEVHVVHHEKNLGVTVDLVYVIRQREIRHYAQQYNIRVGNDLELNGCQIIVWTKNNQFTCVYMYMHKQWVERFGTRLAVHLIRALRRRWQHNQSNEFIV